MGQSPMAVHPLNALLGLSLVVAPGLSRPGATGALDVPPPARTVGVVDQIYR
ncbi:hypothetical protein ABH931_000687 [Streptacidiphilus sp. MAP12-33]